MEFGIIHCYGCFGISIEAFFAVYCVMALVAVPYAVIKYRIGSPKLGFASIPFSEIRRRDPIRGEKEIPIQFRSMAVNNQHCPFCKSVFGREDSVMYCPDCSAPHHPECFRLLRGCAVFGCG